MLSRRITLGETSDPIPFHSRSWVMRDVEGDRPTPLWPYFKREKDVNSLRRGDTIPVNSCWNGMTIFDAKWFLPSNDSATGTPGVDDGPIRFRTHPECNVSECLLPSYDIHVRSKSRPLIFVNPRAVASKCPRPFPESCVLSLTVCDFLYSISIPRLLDVRPHHALQHRHPLESRVAGSDQPLPLRVHGRDW